MTTINFVYKNSKGKIAAYSINNPSYSDHYIQGFCIVGLQIKTFRKDRVIQSFDSLQDAEKLVLQIAPNSTGPSNNHSSQSVSSNARPQNKDSLLEVCFTGFKKADKERLIQAATENKMWVRDGVSVNLQILCCGYNAGPAKIEKARMKGVIILDESEFLSFIETGEIPDAE